MGSISRFVEPSVESPVPSSRQSAIVYSTGEPLEGDYVEFRLLYSGSQLTSNGGPTIKHAIRRAFHPQLKQLWNSHPRLTGLAKQTSKDSHFSRIGDRYSRGNFRFVPLVEKDFCLRVSLDILFLRPDNHPLIKQGGDLDNRLKTLFDALRLPDTTDGLGGAPGIDEDPFFVLLQDDILISEIRVNTDNLLMLPSTTALNEKDVFLVIDVKIEPTEHNMLNSHFRL